MTRGRRPAKRLPCPRPRTHPSCAQVPSTIVSWRRYSELTDCIARFDELRKPHHRAAYGQPAGFEAGCAKANRTVGCRTTVYGAVALSAPRDILRDRRWPIVAALIALSLISAGVILLFVDDLARAAGVPEHLASRAARLLAAASLAELLFVSWLMWRVLGPPDAPRHPDIAGAALRAVGEIGEPGEIARRSLPLLWDRATWIIRRVEHIAFIDRTMTRRRVSVDFRVPADVLELRFGESGALGEAELELMATGTSAEVIGDAVRTRYVPVTVLRSWPPVLNLDLRDGDGHPLPLLSKATTNALDGHLLLALAEHALGEYAEDIRPQLLVLVHDDGVMAQRAFYVARKGIERIASLRPGLEQERIDRLTDLARLLVNNTLLWVACTEPEGSRQIIKLAYDEPARRRLSTVLGLITSLGLRSHVITFEVGQVGDSASFHLEIELPYPLEVLDADLALGADPPGPSMVQRIVGNVRQAIVNAERELALALNRNPPHPVAVDHAKAGQLFTRRVHFYASGQPSTSAVASVRVAPERRGVPLAGAVTGALVAVTLTALANLTHELYTHRAAGGVLGATIGFLLLAPSLTSYVLTRPSDHPFATRIVSGIRTLTVTSLLVSVAAAGVLIEAVAREEEHILTVNVSRLRDAAWALGALLLLGLLLPPRGRQRRGD